MMKNEWMKTKDTDVLFPVTTVRQSGSIQMEIDWSVYHQFTVVQFWMVQSPAWRL